VDSARELVGCKVYFPNDILQKLPPGEYYVHDIIGLDVYDEEGQWLGKIESVFPTGSNDVYVCRGNNKEILLPAVSHVIKQINIHQRMITVKIPNGL
jgi:16S rRNA processing protein RimM